MNTIVDPNWTQALREGDYERAWSINDASLHALCESGAPKHVGERHRQRIWRGEPLAGRRVLVRCYHGLGDTIQFARFLKPLRDIAREVILWCQPQLLPLLCDLPAVDRIMPLHDGAPEVAYDVDIEIMELAHALRANAELIGSAVPYLHARSARHSLSLARNQISVGVVWQAGDWDARRSIPAPMLLPLAIPQVRLFSLQPAAGSSLKWPIPIEDAATNHVADLAATIRQLDLVLTVDTMAAHLAGALGAPVWTMLQQDCDWRWPASGDSTIWYPTMRLFHQRQAGDWGPVIESVSLALRDLCDARGRSDIPHDSAASLENIAR